MGQSVEVLEQIFVAAEGREEHSFLNLKWANKN
jgi:hypothetical protein